tara:strand:+ start:3695 stop:4336 length:642 start_codon:yes stop_codon:yes gene_type:complete
MSFKKTKYKVLREAIKPNVAEFIYNYFLTKRRVARCFFDTRWINPFAEEWGTWNDEQVPGTYSHYGDIAMETLLMGLRKKMEKETGFKLQEAYSYARIYKQGDILHRHKDRYSCEVSTTLNLGGDPWPIYLEPSGEKGMAGIKVDLKPGDMLIYMGCELEHWRDPFAGKDCGQVFLHYNDRTKKTAKENLYDRRPFLGLPAWFKDFKLPSQKK